MRQIYIICVVFCQVFLLPAYAYANITILRSDTTENISTTNIDDVLTQTGIFLEVEKPSDIEIYRNTIRADKNSILYASLSSEYLSLASIDGNFYLNDSQTSIKSGEVLLISLDYNEVKKEQFDLYHLLSSTNYAPPKDIQNNLEQQIAAQKKKQFWGFYDAPINATAPKGPLNEALKRDFLNNKSTIDARMAAKNNQKNLHLITAEKFLYALSQKNEKVVGELLHPALFQENNASFLDWINKRQSFASQITGSNLPKKISKNIDIEAFSDNEFYVRLKQGELYTLKTALYDKAAFVKSFEKKEPNE